MTFTYNTAAVDGLTVSMRMGGTTHRLEMANERALGPDITSTAVTLAATHRNRFTVVRTSGDVVVTLAVYTDIVVGSEHEFLHAGTGTLTFGANTGVSITSASSKLGVVTGGAALVKYLGANTFALIGALRSVLE